ncbi:unnamed protein product [Chrysoparadoxa australica]
MTPHKQRMRNSMLCGIAAGALVVAGINQFDPYVAPGGSLSQSRGGAVMAGIRIILAEKGGLLGLFSMIVVLCLAIALIIVGFTTDCLAPRAFFAGSSKQKNQDGGLSDDSGSNLEIQHLRKEAYVPPVLSTQPTGRTVNLPELLKLITTKLIAHTSPLTLQPEE